jgi:REP element-mobilizing transposase RayT
MSFDSNRHHRHSIRLPGYDYSQPGAYFVTICTYQRECTFGTIHDRTVFLSQFGAIVEQCWRALSEHFRFIELDTFAIMPNHLHGIVVIKDYSQANVGGSNGTRPRSLGAIIQNFKSISTRKMKHTFQSSEAHIWQRNYYERIIRDQAELNNIRRYIETNPDRWNSEA